MAFYIKLNSQTKQQTKTDINVICQSIFELNSQKELQPNWLCCLMKYLEIIYLKHE